MILSEKELQELRRHPIFAEASPFHIRNALENYGAGKRVFRDGESLTAPGDPPLVGFLLSGRATVSTADVGRSVILRFLRAGDVFGIAGLFSTDASVSRMVSKGDCKCILFSERAILELLEVDSAFRKSYVAFLTGRIRFLNKKIEYLTAGSAERRLALYLASLGGCEVCLTESITSLSELLNLGRASLYRAFERLCADGFLVKNGKNLVIKNADAMLAAYKN